MKIEEIDKWLDNEYGCSYTRLEELHDFVVEQDLKHREEKDKEIERLNNIINELEKYLIEYFKKEYPDRKLEDYNLEYCTYDYALVILGKLQELKGDGSNDN